MGDGRGMGLEAQDPHTTHTHTHTPSLTHMHTHTISNTRTRAPSRYLWACCSLTARLLPSPRFKRKYRVKLVEKRAFREIQ